MRGLLLTHDTSYVRFFPPAYSVFAILLWAGFIYIFAYLKMKPAAD